MSLSYSRVPGGSRVLKRQYLGGSAEPRPGRSVSCTSWVNFGMPTVCEKRVTTRAKKVGRSLEEGNAFGALASWHLTTCRALSRLYILSYCSLPRATPPTTSLSHGPIPTCAPRFAADFSRSGRSDTNQEMTSLSPPPQGSLPSSPSLATQPRASFR